MTIQIGQQFGSLEVTALIGKGGMGEVYRARDTKPKRDVTIKVLSDEFARDAERLARAFQSHSVPTAEWTREYLSYCSPLVQDRNLPPPGMGNVSSSIHLPKKPRHRRSRSY